MLHKNSKKKYFGIYNFVLFSIVPLYLCSYVHVHMLLFDSSLYLVPVTEYKCRACNVLCWPVECLLLVACRLPHRLAGHVQGASGDGLTVRSAGENIGTRRNGLTQVKQEYPEQ